MDMRNFLFFTLLLGALFSFVITDFIILEENYEYLVKESLNYSMDIIKSDLKKLGISHDSFISEKSIVK